jgi:hypothetical protein
MINVDNNWLKDAGQTNHLGPHSIYPQTFLPPQPIITLSPTRNGKQFSA